MNQPQEAPSRNTAIIEEAQAKLPEIIDTLAPDEELELSHK
jgi:hypothetical protein